MKKIAFALLVFGIPVLFPIYLIVELGGGSNKHAAQVYSTKLLTIKFQS